MIPFSTQPAGGQSSDGLCLLTAVAQEGALAVRFERIVERGGGIHGLEALCRVEHDELPSRTDRLFELAEATECATELSEILRRRAAAAMSEPGLRLFLNTHPAELEDIPRLLFSLDELRGRWPELHLVLEIHEDAEMDLEDLKLLRRELARLRIEVAYDDFGAGKARFRELVEVPPDYLKIGHELVWSLTDDRASVRGVAQGILRMAASVGARVIAEGPISDREENLCWNLGFDLCQRHDEPAKTAASVRPVPLLRLMPDHARSVPCLPIST
jgi:EAL domain-containing protein (putative c-di-GMP-specific phosphodiesterase class I)